MAKGHKTGGRKKGTANKNTQSLIEKAKELGIDPFETLLRFSAGDWKGLGYDAEKQTKFSNAGIEFDEYTISPELREKAASDACQYIYPKRKAIEHTGADGEPLTPEIPLKELMSDPEAFAALELLEKKVSGHGKSEDSK